MSTAFRGSLVHRRTPHHALYRRSPITSPMGRGHVPEGEKYVQVSERGPRAGASVGCGIGGVQAEGAGRRNVTAGR